MIKREKQTPNIFGTRAIFVGLFLVGVVSSSHFLQSVKAQSPTNPTYTYGHSSQAYKRALSFDPFARKLSRLTRSTRLTRSSSRIQSSTSTSFPSGQRTVEQSDSVGEIELAAQLTTSVTSKPLRRGRRFPVRIPHRPRLRSPFTSD